MPHVDDSRSSVERCLRNCSSVATRVLRTVVPGGCGVVQAEEAHDLDEMKQHPSIAGPASGI
jgi:hypothetical protein